MLRVTAYPVRVLLRDGNSRGVLRADERPMSRCFLASFHPLCSTSVGRAAIHRHRLLPFIDGSCRREPDLEHDWPSISALCRAGKFAPRLQVGDRVAFVTARARYRHGAPWMLVALLRVARRFETHEEAASWYAGLGLRLPSNCMVPGNGPVPLTRTKGAPRDLRDPERAPERIIRVWDARYRERARKWPVMLACEKLMVELHEPARIEQHDWLRWCGRVPSTQNPPEISDELWDHLVTATRRAA